MSYYEAEVVAYEKDTEEKKMNWFDRWFERQCRKAWSNSRNKTKTSPVVSLERNMSARSSINFTIYPASGGWVIEHAKYTRDRDGDGPSLTIVNHGEELGKAVEHIISLESLRS